MRNCAWLTFGVAMVAMGCGGTNTVDSTTPYNRAPGSQFPAAGTGAPAQDAIVGSSLVLNAAEFGAKESIDKVIAAIKRVPQAPKRIFLYGLTPESAPLWATALAPTKIRPIPVYGRAGAPILASQWSKILSATGASKLYGNGPKLGSVNIDSLSADAGNSCSTFGFEGIQFVVVDTDVPVRSGAKAQLPRHWLGALLEKSKSNNVVVLGYRAIQPIGAEDETPRVAIDLDLIVGKSAKIKLFVGAAAAAQPGLGRPNDTGIYQLNVCGSAKDVLPSVGVIEIRANGSLEAKIIGLGNVAKPLLSATLWEAIPKGADTSKPATKSAPK